MALARTAPVAPATALSQGANSLELMTVCVCWETYLPLIGTNARRGFWSSSAVT